MSIFGSIMSKIFGDKVPSAAQASAIPSAGGGAPAAAGATPAVAQAPGAAPMAAVDVARLGELEGHLGPEELWGVDEAIATVVGLRGSTS